MAIVKRTKEEVESPIHDDYVEIYIIRWVNWSSNEVDFIALRSFESFNEEILARATHAIEAGRDYLESEAPGITQEQAATDGMETCTGAMLSDMIQMVKEGEKALAEKNGELANEISNMLMVELLEVQEENIWYKAFLYLT